MHINNIPVLWAGQIHTYGPLGGTIPSTGGGIPYVNFEHAREALGDAVDDHTCGPGDRLFLWRVSRHDSIAEVNSAVLSGIEHADKVLEVGPRLGIRVVGL